MKPKATISKGANAWNLAAATAAIAVSAALSGCAGSGKARDLASVEAQASEAARWPAATLAECPADPRAVAEALLSAFAEGATAPFVNRNCWVQGRHPFMSFDGGRPLPQGPAPRPVAVDDANPFDSVRVRLASDAANSSGPYEVSFRWRRAPANARGNVSARHFVDDSASFYVDPSRSTGKCAVVVVPPRTAALKPSCDGRPASIR